MRILFITTSNNSLCQRAYLDLKALGNEIEIHIADSSKNMIRIVDSYNPELIIAPYLKQKIPVEIWSKITCLIVHPGIVGDKGPSSIDWAILNKETYWGVTIIQAVEEMDAGPIWAYKTFRVPNNCSKSQLYRHEITDAAICALTEAINKFKSNHFTPIESDSIDNIPKGKLRSLMKQTDRKFSWYDSSEEIIRKIKASDSSPGVFCNIGSKEYFVYDAHIESNLKGEPGEIIAYRQSAICIGTSDNPIWIGQLRDKQIGHKLPASLLLKDVIKTKKIPESKLKPSDKESPNKTYKEVHYYQENNIGYLEFNFYNGAMDKEQYRLLESALWPIRKSNIRVLVLKGGNDLWSNGIDLNVIEYSQNPDWETWENINAINNIIKELYALKNIIIISAINGNAGAGGVMLALAADYIYCRKGVVFNPHYKRMGGLYGSEYWTYSLPKRVGINKAIELTQKCITINSEQAKEINLIDDYFEGNTIEFYEKINSIAINLSNSDDYNIKLNRKTEKRNLDEKSKPLEKYREEEENQMHLNAFGSNKDYHKARKNFVFKLNHF